MKARSIRDRINPVLFAGAKGQFTVKFNAYCRELGMTYEEILEDVDQNGVGLTEWEVDFIADIIDKRASGKYTGLTDAQAEKLVEIWEDRT